MEDSHTLTIETIPSLSRCLKHISIRITSDSKEQCIDFSISSSLFCRTVNCFNVILNDLWSFTSELQGDDRAHPLPLGRQGRWWGTGHRVEGSVWWDCFKLIFFLPLPSPLAPINHDERIIRIVQAPISPFEKETVLMAFIAGESNRSSSLQARHTVHEDHGALVVKVQIMHNSGRIVDKNQYNKEGGTIDLKNVKLIRLKDPTPGNWQVQWCSLGKFEILIRLKGWFVCWCVLLETIFLLTIWRAWSFCLIRLKGPTCGSEMGWRACVSSRPFCGTACKFARHWLLTRLWCSCKNA